MYPMPSDPHITYLTQHLTPARLKHSLGVMHVMEALAPVYGLDPTAARIAGLAHDAGKELPQTQMEAIAQIIDFRLNDPSDRDPLYLHGPVSAYVAQHEMGITDALVLEAIARHSYVGKGPVRSPVFCWCLRFADLLEPGRDWDDMRNRTQPVIFAGKMGEAAKLLMDWLIPFLEDMGVTPHPQQRALQRQIAMLFIDGAAGVSNHQVPV